MSAEDSSRIKFESEGIELVNRRYQRNLDEGFHKYCMRLSAFLQDLYDGKHENSMRFPCRFESSGEITVTETVFERLLNETYDEK